MIIQPNIIEEIQQKKKFEMVWTLEEDEKKKKSKSDTGVEC